MTEAQKRVFDDTKIYGLNISQEKIAMQDYLMEREYIRSFGGSQFDYILNFSGTLMFSCLVLKKCIGITPQQDTDLFMDSVKVFDLTIIG
mgnify:CR=1 FL=1